MDQRLEALAALLKNADSIPSMHMTVHKLSVTPVPKTLTLLHFTCR